MPIHQAVILALVQGFTEFLPISSSAHLALAPWLLGWRDQGLDFDVALHFGTLAAVLLYFYRDWLQIAARGFGLRLGSSPELERNPKLLWLLAAGSVPIGILGYLFKDLAEDAWRHNRVLIGAMLIGVGLLMALAERVGRRLRGIGQVGWLDSISIGVAQAVAIVPGTSRSGITIAAGLFRGLDREAAARFSFLLSTPAITAAAFKAYLDITKAGAPVDWTLFLIGMAVSAATGCLAIGLLLRFLRTHTLKIFVYYRLGFGIIVIALATFLRHLTG